MRVRAAMGVRCRGWRGVREILMLRKQIWILKQRQQWRLQWQQQRQMRV
jgi:hypothetical protein